MVIYLAPPVLRGCLVACLRFNEPGASGVPIFEIRCVHLSVYGIHRAMRVCSVCATLLFKVCTSCLPAALDGPPAANGLSSSWRFDGHDGLVPSDYHHLGDLMGTA